MQSDKKYGSLKNCYTYGTVEVSKVLMPQECIKSITLDSREENANGSKIFLNHHIK